MIRLIPDLTRAKAHWTHRSSEVPDFIMVPMSDGTVVRFVPEVEQPGFVKAMESIKNMVVGYETKSDRVHPQLHTGQAAKKNYHNDSTTERKIEQ